MESSQKLSIEILKIRDVHQEINYFPNIPLADNLHSIKIRCKSKALKIRLLNKSFNAERMK